MRTKYKIDLTKSEVEISILTRCYIKMLRKAKKLQGLGFCDTCEAELLKGLEFLRDQGHTLVEQPLKLSLVYDHKPSDITAEEYDNELMFKALKHKRLKFMRRKKHARESVQAAAVC